MTSTKARRLAAEIATASRLHDSDRLARAHGARLVHRVETALDDAPADTPDDARLAAVELAVDRLLRARAASGLPATITDERVLALVGELVGSTESS
jgi:hypothetical protein